MDAVEDIKQRLSIEDVVAEYVQLKRSGRNFKGLSPWTNEKTASLIVSPEKQIWHDFSSSKGGDMFSFIMEAEGVDFKTALEMLARKSGIDLDKYQRSGGHRKSNERLYEANDWAVKFYQTQLKHSQLCLEYLLKKRAFTKETVLRFRLGYAPNGGDTLTRFLLKKGFKQQEITEAGLGSRRYNKAYDMFRGRLMVPLADAQGRVIGFTARLLNESKDSPKYINTPQTALYDKSRHAYGLDLAKDAIRQSGFAVVVEGNLDVIASHQANVANVIATAGTALTEANLKTFARFTSDVRFAFDSDRAGLAATERAIPLAQKTGINMSIISITGGKDPDELIRKDPKLWLDVITMPVYAVDWLIERYQQQLNLSTAQGKRQFTDVILKVIKELSDAVEQDHYVNVLVKLLNVSSQAVRDKLLAEKPNRTRLKSAKPPTHKIDKNTIKIRLAEQHLLAIALNFTVARKWLKKLTPDMLSQTEAAQLLEILKQNSKTILKPDNPVLRPLTDYVNILNIQYEELYQGLDEGELPYEAERLQASLINEFVKNQKAELHLAIPTASGQTLRQLQQKDTWLNQLLKS